MFDVGRVCFKIAGRDSNCYCVIIKKIDNNFVLVDGQTRRKKVNVKHIEPTDKKLDIGENADHGSVVEAFAKMGIQIANKKAKEKTEKPSRQKRVKAKVEKKPVKGEKKKAEKKTAEKKPKKTAEKKE